MFQIRINGIKEITQFMNRLPTELDKNVGNKGILELAHNLQKRIQRRAPKGPTGWLRRSVMVEKNGKWVSLFVHSRYAMAIEEGRGPNASGNYFIPIEYLEQHSSRPESPGEYVSNPKSFVNLRNSRAVKPRPFIRPAIESWRPKINEILIRNVEKALNEANQR
jgi:hypothetical protein